MSFPATDLLANWNAACLRLEDYLRAHRVHDRQLLLQLTLRILEQARQERSRDPSRSPMDLTMETAMSLTEGWFAMIAGDGFDSRPQRIARGRVSYFASDAHLRWPSAFLDPNPPAELVESVRSASIQAGPSLEFTSLIRTEVDYGPMEDIARETWEKLSWSHVLRAFLLWVAIFFAAYFSYFHFFQ